MKKIIRLFLAIVIAFAVSACSNNEENINEESNETANQETTNEIDESNDSDKKALVVYFSRAGENYSVGYIEKGNTALVAEEIIKQTGADVFEIVPVEPYPESYDETTAVAKEEQNNNARPKYKGSIDNLDEYDVVFVGYPNWWGDMPMIMYTFLESNDLSGKTIVPFCTHGGSGFSSTQSTIQEMFSDANMLDGLAIAGTTAQNEHDTVKSEVTSWLNKLGLSLK